MEKRETEGLGPSRKYQKRANELLGDEEDELVEEDHPEGVSREYKTEDQGAVYELVHQEEEPQTVVVMEQPNITYSE